jgi:Leucine-rich repeat (LRR) protein
LTDLPPEIGSLTKLEELWLNNNFILSIPFEIGYLTKLKILELSSNSLDSLPKELGNLTDMDSLFVSNNSLKSLPETIAAMTNLKALYCNNNALPLLPSKIGECTQLKSLAVNNNKLATLPSSILNTKPTQYCNLGYNELATIATDIAAWADVYDPDWKTTQKKNSPIIDKGNNAFKPSFTQLKVCRNVAYLFLEEPRPVRLSLFTINGALVATLLDRHCAAGGYMINLKQMQSHYSLAAGIYLLRMTAGSNTQTVSQLLCP